jgi:hypothetical protein
MLLYSHAFLVPTCLKCVYIALREKSRVIVEIPEVSEFPEVRSQGAGIPVQPSANLIPTEKGGSGAPYIPPTVILQVSSTYTSPTVPFTGPSGVLVGSLYVPPLDPWEETTSSCRMEPIIGLLERGELDTHSLPIPLRSLYFPIDPYPSGSHNPLPPNTHTHTHTHTHTLDPLNPPTKGNGEE